MHTDMRGRGTFGSLKRSHDQDSIGEQTETDLLDGAREPLVALRVVVLETDLQLDRLNKVSFLLAIRFSQEFLD